MISIVSHRRSDRPYIDEQEELTLKAADFDFYYEFDDDFDEDDLE